MDAFQGRPTVTTIEIESRLAAVHADQLVGAAPGDCAIGPPAHHCRGEVAMSQQTLDAVVIGAGWAGLGISYELKRAGLAHQVLERALIGQTWRASRWDSFHLNTVNVQSMLPGDIYQGGDPEGFMTRDEFVAYLVGYAQRHSLPVQENEAVISAQSTWDQTFLVETSRRQFDAHHLVIASGALAVPKRPAFSNQIPPSIQQIDASAYRNPATFPEGAVLIVGSAQSGGQIAEDLALGKRQVFLSTGHVGRMPRRYRGRDFLLWAAEAGLMDVKRETFVDQSGKSMSRPLLGALHTISLQSLSGLGVILLGRCAGVQDGGHALRFEADLQDNIQFGDDSSNRFKTAIDDYIVGAALSAPPPEPDPAEAATAIIRDPAILELDLAKNGITSIVWCTGFKGEYAFLNISDALNGAGEPRHIAGIGIVPGLYFAGLEFAVTRKSGTVLAVAEEARHIVDYIADSRDIGRAG
jgi:putative flavoprotein involved in K+ transport